MVSVSLSYKYLINIAHQTFLLKVKIKHISKLLSLQQDFVLDTFSDAMLYFLFRVKQSYRVRQGS